MLTTTHIADEHDEIDIELVGGDPNHWQTNVFAPAPHEKQPLYATFGATHNYARSAKSVSAVHSYTIDWSPEQIVWRVDGTEVRTLRKGASVLCLCAPLASLMLVIGSRRHEEEGSAALPLAPCASAVRYLGRKRAGWDVGVGARADRLGSGAAADECGVQERRGGVPVLILFSAFPSCFFCCTRAHATPTFIMMHHYPPFISFVLRKAFREDPSAWGGLAVDRALCYATRFPSHSNHYPCIWSASCTSSREPRCHSVTFSPHRLAEP